MFNAFTGTIHGRVQGVGFRHFTQGVAENLGLTGWVRNLPDGTVEVFACGERQTLERFMQSLKAGPVGSRVEKTQFQWLEAQEEFERFQIRS